MIGPGGGAGGVVGWPGSWSLSVVTGTSVRGGYEYIVVKTGADLAWGLGLGLGLGLDEV